MPSAGPVRADDRAQGPKPFRVKSDEALASPPLKRVWNILEAKRNQRPYLKRADIDPGELGFILPYVALIEVHQPPLRFRHRLVGTGYRDVLGFEATNLWVEEWPHFDQRVLIVRCYVATVEAREAIGFRSDLVIDKRSHRYEALIIPLSANGETIDMLFLAGSAGS